MFNGCWTINISGKSNKVKTLTKQNLIEKYNAYLIKLKASNINIPTYYANLLFCENGNANPFILLQRDFYEYKIMERDLLIINKKTDNVHELLYWVFNDILSDISYQYELSNRIDDKADSRVIAFRKKLELFKLLDQNWGEIYYNQIKDILKI